MRVSSVLFFALAGLAFVAPPAQTGLISNISHFFYGHTVRFYFFTKEMLDEDTETYCQLSSDFRELDDAGFNSSLDTKILIHGFASSGFSESVLPIREAYHKSGSYNVIVVDWSWLSTFPGYLRSRYYVHGVAKRVANLIDYLVDEKEVKKEELHLVGHSLGAHVSGLAAKSSVSPGKIGRITGLDPARPLFNILDESSHLSKDDAMLVDVIHTSGKFFGIKPHLGHVDFYPNGGIRQPGCGFMGICGHSRAYWYFQESILNPHAFVAYRCLDEWDAIHLRCTKEDTGDLAVMGEYVQFSEPGPYFLETNSTSPYGFGFNLEDDGEPLSDIKPN